MPQTLEDKLRQLEEDKKKGMFDEYISYQTGLIVATSRMEVIDLDASREAVKKFFNTQLAIRVIRK